MQDWVSVQSLNPHIKTSCKSGSSISNNYKTNLCILSILIIWFMGSKGGCDSTSSTSDKSYGAIELRNTGCRRCAPLMNWRTRGCCPAVLSPKGIWQTDIAAKYTFMVEKAKPLSSSPCRNVKLTGTGLWKAITPANNAPILKHMPFSIISTSCRGGSGTLNGWRWNYVGTWQWV